MPLSEDVLVLEGYESVREELGGETCVADSIADFSTGAPFRGWSYLDRIAAGEERPLHVASDQYSDFFADRSAGPARLSASGAHPGRTGTQPVTVIRRYTAGRAATFVVRGQVKRASGNGDGTGVAVLAGGTPVLARTVLTGVEPLRFERRLQMQAGDHIDMLTDPGPGGDLNFDDVEWSVAVYVAP